MEYCHNFDLSNWETNKDLLKAISYMSLSTLFDEDDNSIISAILSSIKDFVYRCKQDECVGRIVLDIEDIISDHVLNVLLLYHRFPSKTNCFQESDY